MTGFTRLDGVPRVMWRRAESLLHLAVRGSVPKRSKPNPLGSGLDFGSAMTMDSRRVFIRRLNPSLVLFRASSMDWARPICGIQTAAASDCARGQRFETKDEVLGQGLKRARIPTASMRGRLCGAARVQDVGGDRTCSHRARTVWAPASWTTLRLWTLGTALSLEGHWLWGCAIKQPLHFRAVSEARRRRTRIPP